jgi:hypothetical protein
MKTKSVIISFALIAFLFAGAVLFAVFWIRTQAHDIAEYLPPRPVAAGVVVETSDAKTWGHFATRNFTFSAKGDLTAADAASLFEPQLTAAGWQRLASTTDTNVASSSWRHSAKINGGLHLVFTVLQLDTRGKFLGTMTTVPYWPQP